MQIDYWTKLIIFLSFFVCNSFIVAAVAVDIYFYSKMISCVSVLVWHPNYIYCEET